MPTRSFPPFSFHFSIAIEFAVFFSLSFFGNPTTLDGWAQQVLTMPSEARVLNQIIKKLEELRQEIMPEIEMQDGKDPVRVFDSISIAVPSYFCGVIFSAYCPPSPFRLQRFPSNDSIWEWTLPNSFPRCCCSVPHSCLLRMQVERSQRKLTDKIDQIKEEISFLQTTQVAQDKITTKYVCYCLNVRA